MKLHLGCGKRYIPGWVHVDGLKYDHVDHISSLENLSFVDSNSVQIVYASHVLEHFPRAQAESVLSEWHRILEPDGILRLAVPDVAVLMQLYLTHQDINIIKGPLYGGQDHKYNYHYNGFDRKSLTSLLLSVGFASVRDWDWRETDHRDIDDFSQAYFPHMDKENGTLISLNVEAIK